MPRKTLCEICGESFTNIYQHRDTQKHRMNAGITKEEKNGVVTTYLNGKIHSYNDEPAVVEGNVDSHPLKRRKTWYQHGKIHRDGDLPAFTRADGYNSWYQNDKMHRVGGPAIITASGYEEWYQNGIIHRDHEIEDVNNPGKMMIGPAKTDFGSKFWYHLGKPHRVDGPAVMFDNGVRYWYLHGELHRVDGPAIEYQDGSREWYLHGKLHRDDKLEFKNGICAGPAIDRVGVKKKWYRDGKRYARPRQYRDEDTKQV